MQIDYIRPFEKDWAVFFRALLGSSGVRQMKIYQHTAQASGLSLHSLAIRDYIWVNFPLAIALKNENGQAKWYRENFTPSQSQSN